MEPSQEAVFVVPHGEPSLGAESPQRPELLWAAPLSARIPEVARRYADGGLAGLSRVSGPWAAAFTAPGASDVLVAHDPTGIMQLYWAPIEGGVAVSAQLPAIADHPGVDTRPDLDGIALRYVKSGMDAGWIGMGATDFVGVHRVPFGHAIRVGADGSVRQVKFWDPATARPDVRPRTPQEWAEAVIDAIDAAVEASVREARVEATPVPSGEPVVAAAERKFPGDAPRSANPRAETEGGVGRSVLAVQGGFRSSMPAAVADHGVAEYIYASPGATIPAVAVDAAPMIAAADPSLPYTQWATEVDFHRFPSRARDAVVPMIATMADLGVTDLILAEGGSDLSPSGAATVAGLLRHVRPIRALRLARQLDHTGSGNSLKYAARSVARPAADRLRKVPALRGLRARLRPTPPTPAAASSAPAAGSQPGSPNNPTPGAASAQNPLTRTPGSLVQRSLRAEIARRYAATSARDAMVAGWMSGAHHRTIEAMWAYAGVFDVRLHAPLMDVAVVELLLSIPEDVWLHAGELDWLSKAVAERWPTMVESAPLAPEAGVPGERSWTINDPQVAELMSGRPQRTGPTVHPRDWPLRRSEDN